MSRIEFMSELRALLSDLSVEERDEALQYYNDYFDDEAQRMRLVLSRSLSVPQNWRLPLKQDLTDGMRRKVNIARRGTPTLVLTQRIPRQEKEKTQKDIDTLARLIVMIMESSLGNLGTVGPENSADYFDCIDRGSCCNSAGVCAFVCGHWASCIHCGHIYSPSCFGIGTCRGWNHHVCRRNLKCCTFHSHSPRSDGRRPCDGGGRRHDGSIYGVAFCKDCSADVPVVC